MDITYQLLAKKYQQQFDVFAENLKLWKLEPDLEIYHKLRLSIKNIRAMHQLIAPFMTSSFMVSQLNRPYEKVFKRAGQVRNVHLNQQFALLFEMNDEVARQYLKMNKKKLKKRYWFVRQTPNKKVLFAANRVSQKVMQICATLPQGELANRTGQFVSYKMTLIQQLINEPVNDYNLHQIRKHIREIKTVLNLGSGKVYSPEFCQLIDDSSKIIGDWHDRIEFIDSLKSFTARYRKAKIFLQPLILKVKREIGNLSCSVIPMIDRLILVYNRPDILIQKKPAE